MKTIIKTAIFYIADIVFFGSIIGLLLAIGYGIDSLINDKDINLLNMYFLGVAYYWLLDSIASKFRETYKAVKEDE